MQKSIPMTKKLGTYFYPDWNKCHQLIIKVVAIHPLLLEKCELQLDFQILLLAAMYLK